MFCRYILIFELYVGGGGVNSITSTLLGRKVGGAQSPSSPGSRATGCSVASPVSSSVVKGNIPELTPILSTCRNCLPALLSCYSIQCNQYALCTTRLFSISQCFAYFYISFATRGDTLLTASVWNCVGTIFVRCGV